MDKKEKEEHHMRQKPKFPTVSVILMIAFSLIGTLLIILPHGEKIMFGLDIATFTLCYGFYAALILACIYYAKTGK